MPTRYLQSTSGRLMLAAAGFFLAAGAAGVIMISGSLYSLYAIGIAFPIGITLAFVGVGLGMGEYTRETLFSILLLPPALWGFYYLVEELKGTSNWIAYVMAIVALVALAKAAFPGGAERSSS